MTTVATPTITDDGDEMLSSSTTTTTTTTTNILPIDSPTVDGSLPTPEELRGNLEISSSCLAAAEEEVDEDGVAVTTRRNRNRNLKQQGLISVLFWYIACFLVLFVFIVTLAVTLSGRHLYDDDDGDDGNLVSSARPEEPQATYEEVVNFLTFMNISDDDVFDSTTSSPQALAAQWIAIIDEQHLAVPTSQDDDNDMNTINDEDTTTSTTTTTYYNDYVYRYVMAVIYYSLNGDDDWHSTYDFLSSQHICHWNRYFTGINRGVICDRDSTIPWRLYIKSNSASGTIPKEIQHLTTLKTLSVEYNNIQGTIPSEICKLTNLTILELGDNQLNGKIPDCIGTELYQLTKLELNNNQLTDIIPTSLCSLHELIELRVQYNYLKGTIPNCIVQIQNSLTHLRLDHNNMDGAVPWIELCQITRLEILWLQDNAFTGSIDPCISGGNTWSNNLLSFRLSNNRFTGAFPVLSYQQLSRLYIDRNEFTGDIIHILNGLKNRISIVHANNNQFHGDITNYSASKTLRALDLSNNNITGSFPIQLLDIAGLEFLDLSHNMLDGPIPTIPTSKNITKTSLRWLSINDNMFDGPIPIQFIQHLGTTIRKLGFRGMEHLDLSNNDFRGTMPKDIGIYLTQLEYLFMGNNPLLDIGSIPETYQNLTKLREFSIKNTNRNGSIPEFLGDLDDLMLLDLDNNQFTGMIPNSMGGLTELQYLLLNRNPMLHGTVPDTFRNLVKLTSFYLDGTNITDNINQLCQNIPAFTNDATTMVTTNATTTTATTNNDDDDDDVSRMIADCDDDDTDPDNSMVRIECSCCYCCSSTSLVVDDGGVDNDNIDYSTLGCSQPAIETLNLQWHNNFQRPPDFYIDEDSSD